MGLGEVKESKGTYLAVAGGYIWDKKVEAGSANYHTQTFMRADKTEGSRSGARYADLSGKITGVEFKTHDEYGESISITINSDGAAYIVSVSTNNRYSQDLMKALLKMDLDKDIYFKPYDFVDKEGKRAQGIVFRQDGEKIALRNDDAPSKEKDWFNNSNKKQIKRFFEDLTEWFVAEVEEKVVPHFANSQNSPSQGLGESTEENSTEEEQEEISEDKKSESTVLTVTPLKMKKALKEYIKENYSDGETLPRLSKEELVVWYKLSLAEEELPFPEGDDDGGDVAEGTLDDQLGALLDT